MSEGPLPLKRDVAKMLLRTGSLFVHLDPRVADVIVPPWLRHQAQLVLQVGFDMPIPISDLRVDDDGVFGTLSFSRKPFTCQVPWGSIFALVGDEGRGMVWPESMPPEIAAEVEREALRSSLKKVPTIRASTPTPLLHGSGNLEILADSGKSGLHKAPPPPPAARSRGGRRALPPYLRVVK